MQENNNLPLNLRQFRLVWDSDCYRKIEEEEKENEKEKKNKKKCPGFCKLFRGSRDSCLMFTI